MAQTEKKQETKTDSSSDGTFTGIIVGVFLAAGAGMVFETSVFDDFTNAIQGHIFQTKTMKVVLPEAEYDRLMAGNALTCTTVEAFNDAIAETRSQRSFITDDIAVPNNEAPRLTMAGC